MILTAHTIIFIGYNITKQQQVDLLVVRYMKTLHRVTKNIMEKNHPYPSVFDDKSRFVPPKQNQGPFNDKNRFTPPPKPPGIPPFINKNELNSELNRYDLEISTVSYDKIKNEGHRIGYEDEWELYEYNGFKYFYIDEKFREILIKDNIVNTDKTKYIVILTILLNIVFISFYIFLIKKLEPLQKLKKDIVQFSQGNLNIDTSSDGKDEISELSNEFNNAIKEIRQLTESRNLFLRNIMHELKTPITKGSLVSDMMADGKHKDSLKRAFARLQYLLHEFAKIEQLTSKNIKLKKDNYRVIDMIDQAIDILMLERDQIEFNFKENLIVNVDFQLFSLAIKNLIDNGMKYGKSKVIIDIDKNYLAIRTDGDKLPKDLDEYIKPFNRESQTSQSLGLGLYIVQNILNVHNLELKYKYENNQNIFYIGY